MATTSQLLKQLKSRDPQERITAIKKLAKLKSRDALPKLARMAGDDNDPEVRDLAQKAGTYILTQLDGKPKTQSKRPDLSVDAPPEAEYDKHGKLVKVAVSDQDVAKANSLVNEAMTMKDRNQVAKAITALSKALLINPNIRDDPYFISLAETVTNLTGSEAVEKLYSQKMRDSISQKEIDDRKKIRLQEHDEVVSKTSWADVGFDLTLFAIIASVVAIVVGIVITQGAQQYLNRIDQNFENVRTARNLGNTVTNPDDASDVRFWLELNENTGDPVYFSLMTPDPSLWETAIDLGDTEFLVILGLGLAIGVGSAVGLAILNTVAHFVSAKMLSGVGNIRYLMHKNTSLLINRAVLYGVLMGIASVVIFGAGGGIVVQVMGGVLALFSLFVIFKVVSVVGSAYDFGIVKGFVATSIASTVVSLLVATGLIFLLN